MSNQVSFLCSACEATLSIPVELAGISGPCPYCGTHVTSPPAMVQPVAAVVPAVAVVDPVERPRPETIEARPWAEVVAEAEAEEDEEPVAPRPRRTGLLVAAGFVVFVGGVIGAWKLWEASPVPREKESGQISIVEPEPITPRPEVLASAEDGDGTAETLPPPSDDMPEVVLTPVPAAVARDVSTAKPPAVPSRPPAAAVERGPESPLLPVTDPGKPDEAAVPPVPAIDPVLAAKKLRAVIPHTGNLEKPGAALVQFLAAPTWQERLKFVLAPEKMKPLMEAWYQTHPDGPILLDDIVLNRIEPVDEDPSRNYFSFIAYMPEHEAGVPISVEETKAGCLVEWASFVEGKDRALADFYSGYRKESRTFRVLVRLAHYFDKDVPDQDRKVVCDILPPENSGPFKMWIDKDSAAYRQYFATGERTDWRVSSMMVVTLQWEKSTTGASWVRLQDVAADTWHPALLGAGTNSAGRKK